MKAYSLDLRKKIVENYQAGGVSQRELAKRFRVSLNFIVNLLRRWRDAQTLAPKPCGAVMKPLLTREIMQFLAGQIDEKCDLTLCELVEIVKREYKVAVSPKTMSRMLIREGLGLKKNARMRRNAIRKESAA
jgi:transposase